MRGLSTPLGSYWIDDYSSEDTRVGIENVEIVENRGPDSSYRWSLDQEEVLMAAAREAGVELDLLVPGGWRVLPGTKLAALEQALSRCAAALRPTGRKTAPR